ncbi:hypothetical protein S83_008517 [Arachis hypogaea]|uniref:Uncharacterized protein n=1 Tax=Arachis hypogaea TaxID=3818 RepID=A0A445DVN3_ARAHY|nr:hypothetical protein Ahy_A03g013576 isoform A [Arachis hypogaea]
MGAKRSSSWSFCSVFKACFSSGSAAYDDENGSARIFTSDEDRAHWVAEPGIDRKASEFISKYYATRVTPSHSQFAS